MQNFTLQHSILRRQRRTNIRNNNSKQQRLNLQQLSAYRRSPRHLRQRLSHRIQVLLKPPEVRILRYCQRYQKGSLSQHKHKPRIKIISLFVQTWTERLQTVVACNMSYRAVQMHSSQGPMSDTFLSDLRIVPAAIVEKRDSLIMCGQSATVTSLEIAFQIGSFRLRYKEAMNV